METVMKPSRLSPLVAGILAAAIPLAFAQQPTPVGEGPRFVQEPVATTSRDDAVANAIAQELNADPSLKQSKITVQPVEEGIMLTGVTPSYAQMRRAGEIAKAHAGEGQVANVIQSEELLIQQDGLMSRPENSELLAEEPSPAPENSGEQADSQGAAS
jgi:BON domain